MTTPRHVLSATATSGVTLRVAFVWWQDRFGQVISVGTPGGDLATVLSSIEGDAQELWPASPPLQSVSLGPLADGRQAALLVGMAGRSHWSASVEALSGRAALVFDVACRLGSLPASLGTQYSVAAGQIRSGPGEKQREFVEIRTDGPAVRIYREDLPQAATKLRLPESGDIVIRPALPDKLATATVRWKYRVEVNG